MSLAKTKASSIDYINPHGTGSINGDQVELKAFKKAGLLRTRINSTKAIIGHGLTAAGVVEVIATLLQMKYGRLHPSNNLVNPIDAEFDWVYQKSEKFEIKNALTMGIEFGGIT